MKKSRGKFPATIFAVNGLAGGGAERVVVTLANNFRDSESEAILVVGSQQGPYRSEIASHVRVIEHGIDLTVGNTLAFARELRTTLDGQEIRGVLSHLDQMNRMMMRCRTLGVINAPVVVVEHLDLQFAFSNRGHGRLEGLLFRHEIPWLYRRATAVVGVSAGVSASIVQRLNLPPRHVRTIDNPVDITLVQLRATQRPTEEFADQFERLPKPRFLAVGRLVGQKDFPTLLRAFSMLPARERGSLTILGEGAKEGELRSLSRELAIEPLVHFPGFNMNPWWYMARSQCFVLSSAFEGFGLVLVEALACGTPVVSTDCPSGPSEIITDGSNGHLVAVGDASKLSAAMLQTVRASDSELKTQREAGILSIERFRPQFVLSQYMQLIHAGEHSKS